MTTTDTDQSAVLTANGIAAAIAGLGVVTIALFPLAIPILILTAVFVAPLVILPVVAALPIAVVVGVVLAIRAIARRLRRSPKLGVDERRGAHPGVRVPAAVD